jgi:hypothetical protein
VIIGYLITSKQNIRKISLQDLFFYLLLAALQSLNVAISNLSLGLVSLPFHQAIRASTAAFAVILEILVFNRVRSTRAYIALTIVILSVPLVTYGDYSATGIGFALTASGAFLAALKGICLQKLQQTNWRNRPIIDNAFWVSLFVMPWSVCFSYKRNELATLTSISLSRTVRAEMVLNAGLALFLNLASFAGNKQVGSLGMNIAASLKQGCLLLAGASISKHQITVTNWIGIKPCHYEVSILT